MSVAQAEAVLVAAASQPPPADELLVSTLLLAINCGPAALDSSPAVQQLLDDLIERLQASEVSLQQWHPACCHAAGSSFVLPQGLLAAHAVCLLQAFCSTGNHRAFLTALLRHQQLRREPQPGDALELAQAAATRSCAYLRCANLAGEGGPAAGPGTGSQRCSKCKVAWYCGTACSHADWRAGHRRVCRALGAAREAAEVAV
jgi:hypothetical protein